MSSDESAKPHPATRDGNSFDISRRSEEEVAAEIAARLSAWKQARSRSGGTAPSPAPRPRQTANEMVTPGVMAGVMAGAASHASVPHAFSQQRRTAERVPLEPRIAERQAPNPQARNEGTPGQALPGANNSMAANSGVASSRALHRAVPAAPSLGRSTRAFPFRAGTPQPANPIPRNQASDDPAAETPIPVTPAFENPIPAATVAEAAEVHHGEIAPSAEIETPYVDSAPADAPVMDQSAVEPIVVEAPLDLARPARARSIPSPVVETWEDEEAAIAAAGIPRLEIPERITVPMAGRHAARGGTGWAIGLGAILLFLGVTLPATLWQRPSNEATIAGAVPPSRSVPVASAPASVAQMETTVMGTTVSGAPATAAPEALVPGPFGAIAEQKARHAFAPYEALRSLEDGREIAAVPTNVPSADAPSEPSPRDGASAETASFPTAPFSTAARPFIPDASSAHVLVAPPGAARKPAAQLKPVASAAVPPATKVAKPVAQKPRIAKPAAQGDPTVEQMFDQLINTLSNGQPANPAVQPDPPGTRR